MQITDGDSEIFKGKNNNKKTATCLSSMLCLNNHGIKIVSGLEICTVTDGRKKIDQNRSRRPNPLVSELDQNRTMKVTDNPLTHRDKR